MRMIRRARGVGQRPVVLFSWLIVQAASVLAQDCPRAVEVQTRHLVGLWRAEVEGAGTATLLLEPHRDYALSLSGEVNRNGERARLAADIEDGQFTLEESTDGVRISGTWEGEVVDDSCGREIRGNVERGEQPARAFVLRKLDR